MKLLVDNSLSPFLARRLSELGHDTLHLRDLGISDADDEVVLQKAAGEGRALLSADSDFGELLALGNLTRPSVIYFRRLEFFEPEDQVGVIMSNLDVIESAVNDGSIIAIRHNTLRIRRLPIGPGPG